MRAETRRERAERTGLESRRCSDDVRHVCDREIGNAHREIERLSLMAVHERVARCAIRGELRIRRELELSELGERPEIHPRARVNRERHADDVMQCRCAAAFECSVLDVVDDERACVQ